MAPDPVKREYYCRDDEGRYGTFEYVVLAPSAESIVARYPTFAVVAPEDLSAEQRARVAELRYFPGPGRESDAPARHLAPDERLTFRSAQQRAWQELRERFREAGAVGSGLRDPSEMQKWIDIDDDDDFHVRRYGS